MKPAQTQGSVKELRKSCLNGSANACDLLVTFGQHAELLNDQGKVRLMREWKEEICIKPAFRCFEYVGDPKPGNAEKKIWETHQNSEFPPSPEELALVKNGLFAYKFSVREEHPKVRLLKIYIQNEYPNPNENPKQP